MCLKKDLNVGLISLGCSKNQVDAEMMLSILKDNGFNISSDFNDCDIVIVNTCGFIESAKQESIDNILECCALKNDRNNKLELVVVTGCLAQRYKEQISNEIPEVDVVLGIGGNKEIANVITKSLAGNKVMLFPPRRDMLLSGKRILSTPNYFSYLKIADGCNNHCSYCAIPLIRGQYRSVPKEDIIKEVKYLAKIGVKELNIIAQDTTLYGQDIYNRRYLPQLLTEICKTDGIKWVRILYAYPDKLTDELIDVIAREDKIVKYIDIPFQHVNGEILKKMNRFGDAKTIYNLIVKLRNKIPNIIIRTTFMVGFPGETDFQFNELCEFLQKAKIERVGCFEYSSEEDTPAAKFNKQIDKEIKQRRWQTVMEIQSLIIEEFNNKQIGKDIQVMVEGFDEEINLYYGRSYMDAPEIDCKVYFGLSEGKKDEKLNRGDFVTVNIKSVEGYDLVGILKKELI